MQGWIKKQVKSQRETVLYATLALINNDKNFNEVRNGILSHSDDEGFELALDLPIYEPRPNQISLPDQFS